MRYVWATGTHRGRVRAGNEDAVFPETSGAGEGPLIVAVADGMGGHIAGEVASRLAIDAAARADAETDVSPAARVQAGNEAILAAITDDPALTGMGTTLTLGRFTPDGTLTIAHVGDSRAYLLRHGTLSQLTEDHTVVAELVSLGHLSEAAAARHPQRHLLTRSLGLGPVRVDELAVDLHEGDRVLFCSDGLTTMLDDEQIARHLREEPETEAVVWALIEAANAAGGLDNTTVAVVDVRT